jgi:hypothetical protein
MLFFPYIMALIRLVGIGFYKVPGKRAWKLSGFPGSSSFSLATGNDPYEKEGRRKYTKHRYARGVSKQNASYS